MSGNATCRVRPATFWAVLARADMSIAALAVQLGMTRSALHSMVHGKFPISSRVFRDVPLALARRTEMDPDEIRSAIFEGEPIARSDSSYFDRQRQEEAHA